MSKDIQDSEHMEWKTAVPRGPCDHVLKASWVLQTPFSVLFLETRLCAGDLKMVKMPLMTSASHVGVPESPLMYRPR